MSWWVTPVLTLALLATPVSATLSGPQGEVGGRQAPVALSAIGMVSGRGGIGQATGFLVSDCEALTAKHIAGRVPTVIGRRMLFRTGGRDGPQSRATVIAEGDFDLAGNWFGEDRRGDWVLMRLDQCLGRDLGHVVLSAVPFFRSGYWAPGTPNLESAGFPFARRGRDRLTRGPRCRIRASRGGNHLNDCAARPGDSGSPLFVIGRNGVLTVFAMQSVGRSGTLRTWAAYHSNIAIAVDDILPHVAPLLTRSIVRDSADSPLFLGPGPSSLRRPRLPQASRSYRRGRASPALRPASGTATARSGARKDPGSGSRVSLRARWTERASPIILVPQRAPRPPNRPWFGCLAVCAGKLRKVTLWSSGRSSPAFPKARRAARAPRPGAAHVQPAISLVRWSRRARPPDGRATGAKAIAR